MPAGYDLNKKHITEMLSSTTKESIILFDMALVYQWGSHWDLN